MTPRPEQPATAAGIGGTKNAIAFRDRLINAYRHSTFAINEGTIRRIYDESPDLAIEAAAAALPDVAELAAALHAWVNSPAEDRIRPICEHHADEYGYYAECEVGAAAILAEIERARG